MNFNELRLTMPIVRAVADLGYTTPTPIQIQAIPEILAGRDVMGCAQTGTGKTCAFALPILQRLSESKPQNNQLNKRRGLSKRTLRALILCPTRELASQIFDSFKSYGRNLPLKHAVVYGGVNQMSQVRALREGVDVLIATPGRLFDLIRQGYIDLCTIETLVLDEADRMLDMGFINDIRKIIEMIPSNRQTLLFSATISPDIHKLASSILKNPVCLETTPEFTTVDTITQQVYMVDRKNKPLLLERLLEKVEVGRALVFTRTKHGADALTKILRRLAINVEAIHGNKTQNARTRAMNRFKSGSTTVLIATDIASRGIDVDDITHVVNFDMPIDPETYVHRIGRTARAGASGIAVSFCDHNEIRILQTIERRTRNKLSVADDNADLTFKATDTLHRDIPTGKSKSNGRSRMSKTSGRNRNSNTNTNTNLSGSAGKPNNGGGNPGKSKNFKTTRKSNNNSGNWKTNTRGQSGKSRGR